MIRRKGSWVTLWMPLFLGLLSVAASEGCGDDGGDVRRRLKEIIRTEPNEEAAVTAIWQVLLDCPKAIYIIHGDRVSVGNGLGVLRKSRDPDHWIIQNNNFEPRAWDQVLFERGRSVLRFVGPNERLSSWSPWPTPEPQYVFVAQGKEAAIVLLDTGDVKMLGDF